MLAYNCSPVFNWRKNLDDATIARFQPELARMGYKFQFVTLAGFHALNLSMFELARGYKIAGMTAYSRLQEKEFSRETQYGYEAVKHQRFVGTGYFDQVQQVISGGLLRRWRWLDPPKPSSSWEKKPIVRPEHGPDAACQPILGDCPHTPVRIDLAPKRCCFLPGTEPSGSPSGFDSVKARPYGRAFVACGPNAVPSCDGAFAIILRQPRR